MDVLDRTSGVVIVTEHRHQPFPKSWLTAAMTMPAATVVATPVSRLNATVELLVRPAKTARNVTDVASPAFA